MADNSALTDLVFNTLDKQFGSKITNFILGSRVVYKFIDKYKSEIPTKEITKSLEVVGVELKPLVELFGSLQSYRAHKEAVLLKDIKEKYSLEEQTAFALIERASLAHVVTGVMTSAIGQLGGLLSVFKK